MPLLALLLALLATPSDALAYIDPGSGMLFWQGLVAAIGGALIFLRQPLQTIKAWMRRLRRK